MESLPVELLDEILGHLCFHCQHPGVFPHADTEEVRGDKKALARVCRVSKTMRAAAQPILYHYYATGNLPVETKLYDDDDFRQFPHLVQPDFMTQFLRTIIDRPDLASQITIMQIVDEGLASRVDNPDYAAMMDSLAETSVSRNLLAKPGEECLWTPETAPWWEGIHHRWLATLAMILCPRLESILLALDFDAEFELRDVPHLRLPSLRTLALIGGNRSSYYFDEAHLLYAAAPNLEVIYSCDPPGTLEDKTCFNGRPYDFLLPRLKKLVISQFWDSMEELLQITPKLETLEYYWENGREHYFHNLDMLNVLQPVSQTLKRLCLSFVPFNSDNLDDPPIPRWIYLPEVNYRPISTLRDFTRLEHLSIDCRSIFREEDRDEAGRLVKLLPTSIRSLRILYVYRPMGNSLCQLALDAPTDFTQLKGVEIGIAQRTNPQYHDGIAQMKVTASAAFEASGISITWTTDLLGPEPKTMIPGATAGSKVISMSGY